MPNTGSDAYRRKFHAECDFAAMIIKWVESERDARLSSEIGESLPDLFGENKEDHNWSTTDYAEVGFGRSLFPQPLWLP